MSSDCWELRCLSLNAVLSTLDVRRLAPRRYPVATPHHSPCLPHSSQAEWDEMIKSAGTQLFILRKADGDTLVMHGAAGQVCALQPAAGLCVCAHFGQSDWRPVETLVTMCACLFVGVKSREGARHVTVGWVGLSPDKAVTMACSKTVKRVSGRFREKGELN